MDEQSLRPGRSRHRGMQSCHQPVYNVERSTYNATDPLNNERAEKAIRNAGPGSAGR